MERELESRARRVGRERPAAVSAAARTVEAVKEMDGWERSANEARSRGEEPPSTERLSEEARTILAERAVERQGWTDRLREIEIQVRDCKALAENTRRSIMRGDQYVNYSNITLKAGGPHTQQQQQQQGSSRLEREIDREARINPLVLRVPECGVCAHCTDPKLVRRLCLKRLEVRNKLLKDKSFMEGSGGGTNSTNSTNGTGKKSKRSAATASPSDRAKYASIAKGPIWNSPRETSARLREELAESTRKERRLEEEIDVVKAAATRLRTRLDRTAESSDALKATVDRVKEEVADLKDAAEVDATKSGRAEEEKEDLTRRLKELKDAADRLKDERYLRARSSKERDEALRSLGDFSERLVRAKATLSDATRDLNDHNAVVARTLDDKGERAFFRDLESAPVSERTTKKHDSRSQIAQLAHASASTRPKTPSPFQTATTRYPYPRLAGAAAKR